MILDVAQVPDLQIDVADAALPLEVDNLSIAFNGVPVVNSVSFSVRPGECVALVGESGSGKSVTARALLGLAGAEVSADGLRAAGRDLTSLSPREWRDVRGRIIGLALQDALLSLDQLRRVRSEVAEAPLTHGLWRRDEARARAIAALADVGIPEPELRADQYPHQLSGGLRQRALVASALSGTPPFVIADEPTTALDVSVQAQVVRLLRRLVDDGTGVLFITHDLALVPELADRVLVLDRGRVVEEGAPHEIFTRPRHRATRTLVRATPTLASRGRRLSDEPSRAAREILERRGFATAANTAERAATPPVLEARAVGKTFHLGHDRELHALCDVSLEVAKETVLGIVGESGSGKTTLGRILMGFTTPSTGSVLLNGRRWSELPERRRRKSRYRIQQISQDPLSSFDPRHDVARILDEALRSVNEDNRPERAEELLECVGLGAAHLSRMPRTLSGGQRQRVAIARALATSPDVLVCDEAVSALDVSIQAQVLDLLADLTRTAGVTIVFISHDLPVVHYLADKVAVMKDGRVVEYGDATDVFERPSDPYTRHLLSMVPQLPHGSGLEPGSSPR